MELPRKNLPLPGVAADMSLAAAPCKLRLLAAQPGW